MEWLASMINHICNFYNATFVHRGMAYLHNEPNVIVHRDLKPRFGSLLSILVCVVLAESSNYVGLQECSFSKFSCRAFEGR